MYTWAPSTSEMSGAMFRGTEMSKNLRMYPTASPPGALPMSSTWDFVTRSSSDELAAKTASASPTHFRRSGSRANSKSISGKSAASSSHRGMERLTMVTRAQPLEARCFTRRRVILPAPMMQIRASLKQCVGSFIWHSSAAAEETETAPEAIDVSVRTRLPAWIACLKSPFRCRPYPSASWPYSWTLFTCARICPSPITSESRPAETRRRCFVASLSRSRKRYGRSSSMLSPLFWHSQLSTSFRPRCQDSAPMYSSMRLHVERTAASSMCGKAVSSPIAPFHSSAGVARRSRISTGAVCTERPMQKSVPLGSAAYRLAPAARRRRSSSAALESSRRPPRAAGGAAPARA